MEIKPQELRIGNWVKWPNEKEPNEVQWEHGHWLGVFEKNYGYPHAIELTPEWLTRLGFNKLPHFNITNAYIKDIGRNRIISVGNVGTGNEMIWICELNDTDKTKIDDLVCIRNFNYDGRSYVHTIQNIYHDFKGEELAIDKTSLKN